MGFRNGKTGFPGDVLASRSLIKKGEYALITPDGMVNNVIPGFTNCDATILASPKLGATFVDYLVDVRPGGGVAAFGGGGVETFAYVVAGEISAVVGGKTSVLAPGGYIFCPPSKSMDLSNPGGGTASLFLYKRRYRPAKGFREPPVIIDSVANLRAIDYEGMENLKFYNFLPSAGDPAFDMNMHILSFERGASHGYVETHVQEHGAYILSGSGMYNLGGEWMPVRAGDYIFMGAYVRQAAYAVGREGPFAYIYSKDCNRDEEI
ncbi:MAG: (S)-ureidoglycine aminohydrolase [Planctomycetota bacterium]|jgi:(S)-ureidoglycine aminohydrolase|nr:(S)-ureidoglycine aminohydrolase [Planctomycetota bacterium]